MPNSNAPKLVFLSHISEERDLAVSIKEAIETEFSGFVEVFVSSDGISIPTGSNFLKRIEDGLINCIGAIYLISPKSVARPWVNFELGAVWIRSVMSQRGGGPEVPTLPFCHSGMTFKDLPMPIVSLNAILASEASQLRFAFMALQIAVGGRGSLKTNFDELAEKVKSFETRYTILEHVQEFLTLIGADPHTQISYAVANPDVEVIDYGRREFTSQNYERLLKLLRSNLSGIITVNFSSNFLVSTDEGSHMGTAADVTCKAEYIRRLDGN